MKNIKYLVVLLFIFVESVFATSCLSELCFLDYVEISGHGEITSSAVGGIYYKCEGTETQCKLEEEWGTYFEGYPSFTVIHS